MTEVTEGLEDTLLNFYFIPGFILFSSVSSNEVWLIYNYEFKTKQK